MKQDRTPQENSVLASSLIKEPKVQKVWSYWSAKYSRFMDFDEVESCIGEAFRRALLSHDFTKQQFHSSFAKYLEWEFDTTIKRKAKRESLLSFSPLNTNSQGRLKCEVSEHALKKFGVAEQWMNKYLSDEVRNTIDRVYLRGYTIKQVAEEDNCTENAVFSTLTYGLKKLKEVSQKYPMESLNV